MKTPKEKAEELVYEFTKHVVSSIDYDNAIGLTNPTNTHLYKERLQFEILQRAKQCALIAVDELIEQENQYNNGSFYYSRYWKEVKTELENL